MEAYSPVRQQDFVELPGEPSDAAAPPVAGVYDAEVARSEENILRWM